MVSILLFFSCKTQEPLETVKTVDLEKYAGKWYEIASFPTPFQKGCQCTTAEYSLEKGYVKVVNTCRRGQGKKASGITGKAFAVKGSNNTRLRVQFFWPFRGDYWIIDLADDYSYSVVGNQNRKYLWILGRSPQMSDHVYDQIVKRAALKGFDVSKLKKTQQDACE